MVVKGMETVTLKQRKIAGDSLQHTAMRLFHEREAGELLTCCMEKEK